MKIALIISGIINRAKEKRNLISKLSTILTNCEEIGSLDQVDELNKKIRETLEANPKGNTTEYLELTYKVAKILNFQRDSLNEEYFTKVKKAASKLTYQELIDIANKWTSKKDYYGAIFIYTVILAYHTRTHDIYYKRAMTYYHLKQNSLAIQDIDAAIEDIKLDNALTNQLSHILSVMEIFIKKIKTMLKQ